MYKNEDFRAVLQKRLTKKRYIHSLNVAEAARELAELYGCDSEKAYTVGLIHDCCKDTPSGLQLAYLLENKEPLTDIEINTPKLYHAMSGKVFCQKEFGISDYDMLNAVRYHTTGRKGMSLLEKVVFIADFISAERDYNGVEIMRKKAKCSLEEAIIEGLGFTIKDLIDRGAVVHPDTLDAYNEAMFKIIHKRS